MFKRLPDGTPVLIRPIRSDDKSLLSTGLAQLSEESIQRRFLSPKRRFTTAELRYLTEVDGWDHVALVAEAPNRRCIGVARYVRLQDDHEAAEVAFVVADDYQRRGVATILAEELGQRAKMRGVKRFTATMATSNVAAHRLMAKLSSHLERHHAGAGLDELSGSLAA